MNVLCMVPARYATVPTCEVSAHTLLFAPLQWETAFMSLHANCSCSETFPFTDPERQTDVPFRHLVPGSDHQTVSVLTFFLKTRA